MIDIENIIINTLVTALPNVNVVGSLIESPESFPCVAVEQIDSYVYNTQDSSSNENHDKIAFQIEIYSNKQDTAKSECKAIAKTVDDTMLGMKFNRTFLNRVKNADSKIYRLVGRYEGVVAKGVTHNGTTTFQMYRK